MDVESVPIAAVVPYDRNPRNNSGAVRKVAASIREFGFRQPIVVDEGMVVIAGHTRLLAAKELGLETVPVHIARGLSPKQARAYRLADNRVAQEATWDDHKLREELAALRAEDFDLGLTGFDDAELAKALATLGEADPDTVPDAPARPVAVAGDVWLLGPHRLVCGDSTDEGAVRAALAGEKPNLMVTDPPYGVEYDPTWRDDAGGQFGDGKTKMRGLVANDERADWSQAWALFPGSVAYIWHASLRAGDVHDSLTAVGFVPRAQIIWVKSHFTLMRTGYHWHHEPCWYAVRKGGKSNWTGDRKQTTVWEIQGMNPAGRNRDAGNEKTGHGTQKPVECMKRPIENNSNPGEHIYEPFSGSGTTIIAAEMTGRVCHAIELDPIYVDVAIKRWEQFTGKRAMLEATGKSFEDMADARYDFRADGMGSYEEWCAHMRNKSAAA